VGDLSIIGTVASHVQGIELGLSCVGRRKLMVPFNFRQRSSRKIEYT
jgi:hypothetical protein